MTPTTAPQLSLPFDSPLRTWTDAVGPQPARMELSVALTPTGARLRLVGPWPSDINENKTLPSVRGLLWQAEVDLADPRRTRIAPAPQGCARSIAFPHDLPLPDCFTAPLAWAAQVGARHPDLQPEVDRLLMAMRRSLVLVARHLAQVLEELRSRPRPAQCSLFAEAV